MNLIDARKCGIASSTLERMWTERKKEKVEGGNISSPYDDYHNYCKTVTATVLSYVISALFVIMFITGIAKGNSSLVAIGITGWISLSMTFVICFLCCWLRQTNETEFIKDCQELNHYSSQPLQRAENMRELERKMTDVLTNYARQIIKFEDTRANWNHDDVLTKAHEKYIEEFNNQIVIFSKFIRLPSTSIGHYFAEAKK